MSPRLIGTESLGGRMYSQTEERKFIRTDFVSKVTRTYGSLDSENLRCTDLAENSVGYTLGLHLQLWWRLFSMMQDKPHTQQLRNIWGERAMRAHEPCVVSMDGTGFAINSSERNLMMNSCEFRVAHTRRGSHPI